MIIGIVKLLYVAMDMVDETDCNIMVKVAGDLRNNLGEEAGNNRKVRKVIIAK